MAKNQATGSRQRSSALRDRSQVNGTYVKGDADTSRSLDQKRSRANHREILFPTEPTTIPREKIDRAIERVISRRK